MFKNSNTQLELTFDVLNARTGRRQRVDPAHIAYFHRAPSAPRTHSLQEHCAVFDRRIISLTAEIRDLYCQTCTVVNQINAVAHEIETGGGSRRAAQRARLSTRTPELARFETAGEQRAALSRALGEPQIRRRTKAVRTAIWGLMVTAYIWLELETFARFSVVLLVGVLGLGLLWCADRLFLDKLIQQSLRRQLVARGVPICIACGYDLRGQIEPRCPECGTPAALADFRPAVAPPAQDSAFAARGAHERHVLQHAAEVS